MAPTSSAIRFTAAVVMKEVTAQVRNSSRSGTEYWSIETGDKNSRGGSGGWATRTIT